MTLSSVYNSFLALIVAVVFASCSSLKTGTTPSEIKVKIDLINVQDDQVFIEITPPKLKQNEIVFYIPQIVPGTYEYSNFGRFVNRLQAFDKKGNAIEVTALDENSWRIARAKKLDKITYWANDTFDGPDGSQIYPMGGTNFEKDSTYLLNLHSMIGYFEDLKEIPYRLEVHSPDTLKPFTSLPALSASDSKDVFLAQRYFHIIDNPILYSAPNAVSFDLDAIKVGLAIYSPSGKHKAEAYQPAIQEMMVAQKNFLGQANNTKRYDILLHLMDMEDLQYFGGMMGALEHHTSTTVVFVDDMQPDELTQSLVDVVSHEFFHTLTPLNIHSEEIHNFEYNKALMSQHLWMYEGTTEYFANLFQINQGLIDTQDFYGRILEKVDYSRRYDDALSFTEMSAGIVDEPYASNYANVYQKGALINMCLDLIIREQSGGEKGILWVMQNLAKKYGTEKPFNDSELIDEIVAMTYPEVGTFFTTHVIGSTPIDYATYFTKVGLMEGEVNSPLPGILFQNKQMPFFRPQANSDGIVQYVVTGLNSTLEAMGVQLGDIFLGLNDQRFPEIKAENGDAINAIFSPTFMWGSNKEFSVILERDGQEIPLQGTVGEPSAVVQGLVENPNAPQAAIDLRNAWMFN